MPKRSEDRTPPYNGGDVVQLISGGPKMTIVGPDRYPSSSFNDHGPKWVCQWFSGSKLSEQSFAEHVLKPYKPDDKK